jgi:hypothetical protein
MAIFRSQPFRLDWTEPTKTLPDTNKRLGKFFENADYMFEILFKDLKRLKEIVDTTVGNTNSVRTVVDTANILVTDSTIVCNKATNFTITLPIAVIGQRFNIKNIGVGDVTVAAQGADTIDWATTQVVVQWEGIEVQCIAANTWVII